MTQDEINEMVKQAGFHGMISIGVVMDAKQLEAFAELVAAKERDKWMNKAVEMLDTALNAQREVDAKICEALKDDGGEWDIQQQCANAIRARGEA